MNVYIYKAHDIYEFHLEKSELMVKGNDAFNNLLHRIFTQNHKLTINFFDSTDKFPKSSIEKIYDDYIKNEADY
jgi:hypothetical protein